MSAESTLTIEKTTVYLRGHCQHMKWVEITYAGNKSKVSKRNEFVKRNW